MTEYFRDQLDLEPSIGDNTPSPFAGDDFELPAPQCDRDSDEPCESCQ